MILLNQSMINTDVICITQKNTEITYFKFDTLKRGSIVVEKREKNSTNITRRCEEIFDNDSMFSILLIKNTRRHLNGRSKIVQYLGRYNQSHTFLIHTLYEMYSYLQLTN